MELSDGITKSLVFKGVSHAVGCHVHPQVPPTDHLTLGSIHNEAGRFAAGVGIRGSRYLKEKKTCGWISITPRPLTHHALAFIFSLCEFCARRCVCVAVRQRPSLWPLKPLPKEQLSSLGRAHRRKRRWAFCFMTAVDGSKYERVASCAINRQR